MSDRGLVNTVCTTYELLHGDDTESEGEEFLGVEISILEILGVEISFAILTIGEKT